MPSLAKELKVAKLAVQRAARLTQAVAETQFNSITKSDDSPVTIADFGAQAIIISAIQKNFPGDKVVGEEDAAKLRADKKLSDLVWSYVKNASNDASSSGGETEILGKLNNPDEMMDAIDFGSYSGGKGARMWALDPIDGTKGYLRKQQYAICLALLDENAKVVLGVIGCPNLPVSSGISSSNIKANGSLFSAVVDEGAYEQPLYEHNEYQEELRKIHFKDIKSTQEASFCQGVEKGHSNHSVQEAIAQKLGITREPVEMDSQAKYCSISRGDGDIYLRIPTSATYEEKIWDHAAGNILVTEAGGVVSDCEGAELDFGLGRTLKHNKGVIAASRQIHADVIKVVKEVRSGAV